MKFSWTISVLNQNTVFRKHPIARGYDNESSGPHETKAVEMPAFPEPNDQIYCRGLAPSSRLRPKGTGGETGREGIRQSLCDLAERMLAIEQQP